MPLVSGESSVSLAELIADIVGQEPEPGSRAEPVVGLDLFFEGNDDPASIGCNLAGHPGTATFHRVLRAVRDRPEVEDVQVGITEVMAPDEWPFSDHVYVVGTMSAEQVAAWCAPLRPDDARYGWWRGVAPRRLADVPPEVNVVHIWWD